MRIGLVGAGRIGEVHARSILADPRCTALVVHDADHAAAERIRASNDAASSAPTIGALLAQVDAIVIASPTPTHLDLVRLAVAAGLPTLCEKPVATTLQDVVDLTREVEAAGSLVQIGFHYRFDPALRDLANRSWTSGPKFLRVHSTTEFAPSSEYLADAGGLVADKLIHELDMVRWITGAEAEHVSALPAGSAEGTDAQPSTAVISIRLDDGGLATLWGGYRSVSGFDLTVELEDSEAVVVTGNRRAVSDGPRVLSRSSIVDFRDRFAAAYEAEVRTFIGMARGEQENPCPLREALRTQHLVAAAQEALAEQRVVSVDYRHMP